MKQGIYDQEKYQAVSVMYKNFFDKIFVVGAIRFTKI